MSLIVKYIIEQDEGDNPRAWDNLGVMICFHKRYKLGDLCKHSYNHQDYSGWDEMEEAIRKNEDVAVILPLFLYDHGGVHLKVGSIHGLLPQGHAKFDSGQVGFIYASKADVRKEYGRLTKKTLEKIKGVLRGEVEVYNQYLNGDVWRFRAVDENGKTVDSCGGFYGYDIEQNDMRDFIPKGAVVEYR